MSGRVSIGGDRSTNSVIVTLLKPSHLHTSNGHHRSPPTCIRVSLAYIFARATPTPRSIHRVWAARTMLVLLAKGKRTRHLKKRVCTWVLSAELRGRLNVLTFLTIRIDTIGISNTLIGVRFLLITLQYVNARRTYHTPPFHCFD